MSSDNNMGSCSSCTKGEDDSKNVKDSGPVVVRNPYKYEQNQLDNTVMKSGACTHSAIIEFDTGALRAWSPPDFIPDKQGIDDIIDAFKGDTDGIVDRGISMGCGTNSSVPGKMEEGKAIFGNDGKHGGCSVFRTKKSLLVLVFNSDPTKANRIGIELSDHMTEEGH